MSSPRIVWILLAVTGSVAGIRAQTAPAWAEVRDTLERHCLECHGGERVKSEFRLATAATFAHGGSRGPVFDAERPHRSRILEAIRYTDPDLAMPPDGELPATARATLEAWILAGAAWPDGAAGRLADPARFPDHDRGPDPAKARDHWAYKRLVETRPPAIAAEWRGHPIDAFVRAKLDAAGLDPAAAAAPETMLRRASFALIGLPPTPDERRALNAAIATDGFDAAWSTALDRLLASPRYGEHQARLWLDQVRYAETNGYERDATKQNIWRYRDWVIRAFNRDKPYDRFVLEQLAGDELATLAPEELEDPNDPDPLLATGYYRLNVWDDEPADARQARADELADIVDTTGQVLLAASVGCARCHDHKADPISQRDYFALTAIFNNVTGYGGDRFGQQLGAGMTRELPDRPGEGQISQAELDRRIAAIDAELDPLVAQLRQRAGDTGAPRTLIADARTAATQWRWFDGEPDDGWTRPGFDDSEWPEGPAGFGTAGTLGAHVGTTWAGKQIALRTRFPLTEIPTNLVLSLHHDEDLAVWINGVPVLRRRGYRVDYDEVQLLPSAAQALVVGSNVVAVACQQTDGGQYVDIGVRTGWLDDAEAGRARLAAEASRWLPAPAARRAQDLLRGRSEALAIPIASGYPALVVTERGPTPPTQHVMLRGSAHALGDVVDAAVPAVLNPKSVPFVATTADHAASTGRRLAFVRWLFGDGRDFTARVFANRLWQASFGRGLCRTPGDFGHFGEAPTHPQLLDHLARVAIDRAWSTKAMYRYLLTSRAFRMGSAGDATAALIDPRNDLYWRFDPRRLTGEQYRDAVLAVAGTLNHRLYGPSVFPPLAPEVLATSSRPGQAWGHSSPQDAARRSIYVFVKRSLRVPLLAALDQPDPDLPCADRFPTNVPTQALMTLNGAFTAAAAKAFAARLMRDHADGDDRIRAAVARALGRSAQPFEVARHREFLEKLRRDQGLDADAALVVLCLGLFNLNEFLWID